MGWQAGHCGDIPAEFAGNMTSATHQKSALGCWRKMFLESCLFTAVLVLPKGGVRGSCWLLGIADHSSLQEPGAEETVCTVGASIGGAVHTSSNLMLKKLPVLLKCNVIQTAYIPKAA